MSFMLFDLVFASFGFIAIYSDLKNTGTLTETSYFALLYIVIGIVIFSIPVRNFVKKCWYKSHGLMIHATVIDIIYHHNIRINNKNVWSVMATARHSDTGEVYTFKSKYMTFNPSEYVSIGETISLFVNRYDWKKYYFVVNPLKRCF